jgi:predicted RNA binding protein YcfA (HicA-like mRNA interferase family)
MKKTELIQRLNQQGAVLLRRGGKHDVYVQPKTNKEATVPRHTEINEFTAKAILKKLS